MALDFAWAAALLAAAGLAVATIATVVLLRTRRRLAGAHVEVERLGDLVWTLREKEEEARRLVEGQDDPVIRRALNGTLTYANNAACLLAGRPRESLVGTAYRFPATETIFVGDGDHIRRTEAIQTPRGRRWIEWHDMPTRGQSDPPETLSVGRDVTARQAAQAAALAGRQAAESASAAKSRFLATVTHELRTPLGGILGMAGLLLESRLTPDQRSYAQAVKGSAESLLALIEDNLDLSRIEAGHLDLAREPFDLAALVETTVELLAPRAQAKGLELVARLDPALPPRLLGDAGRIKQILLNLAGNAVKFTEAGGVVIHVQAEAGAIRLCVRDTGIGIAETDLPLIFREFEQAEPASNRAGGSGLGLAITQRLVEHMGGAVSVASVPGEGSVFTVELPLPPAGTPAEAPASAAATGEAPAPVLVASPSAVLRDTLAAVLMERGIPAAGESDAALAATRIEAESFGVLLIDAAFGLDAATALAGRALAAGRRVVALLAPSERRHIAPLAASGAASYLIKPVRVASLLAQIRGMPAPWAEDRGEARQPEASLAGMRILLAEDDAVNALLATAILGRLGARVERARNGREAVSAYAEQSFDAVLMDMRMPELDGLAATKGIREIERREGRPRVPIHALTASLQPADRLACLAAGMDEVLAKPFDREAVLAVLRPLAAAPSRTLRPAGTRNGNKRMTARSKTR